VTITAGRINDGTTMVSVDSELLGKPRADCRRGSRAEHGALADRRPTGCRRSKHLHRQTPRSAGFEGSVVFGAAVRSRGRLLRLLAHVDAQACRLTSPLDQRRGA
jgi:hypothetical protein